MSDDAPLHRMPPAEQEVDEARARALLGPTGYADEPLRLLGVGWDNTVWRVGEGRVARFPRRATALPLLELEMQLLPVLAGRLPLPVPVPERVQRPEGAPGAEATGYPWPFWVGRAVPGRELAHAGLPEDRREQPATDVGALLGRLHAPALAGVARAEVPALRLDPNGRGDVARRAPWVRQVVDRACALGLPTPPARDVTALLEGAARARGGGRQPVLCHGDLHLRHVLVLPDGHAGGVIDWGDACLADPAIDLTIAYAAFTGKARDDLLAAYRAAGGVPPAPDQVALARLLALGLSAMLAATAYEAGDPALRDEAVAGMTRALT